MNFSRPHQLESQYEQLSAAGAPDHETLLAAHVGVNEPPEHRGFANVAAANKADQIPEVVVVGILKLLHELGMLQQFL